MCVCVNGGGEGGSGVGVLWLFPSSTCGRAVAITSLLFFMNVSYNALLLRMIWTFIASCRFFSNSSYRRFVNNAIFLSLLLIVLLESYIIIIVITKATKATGLFKRFC